MKQGQGLELSIVICTYRRPVLLKNTLEHMAKAVNIELAEVIIIDNNSEDETEVVVFECIKRIPHMNIRYVLEEQQGLSYARNRGVEESKGQYIAFLDDDAVPTIHWIESIFNAFHKFPNASALGGVIHPNFEGERPSWLIKELELPFTIVNLGDQVMEYPANLHPFGANMVFKRNVFDQLLFPTELGRKGESLLSGEETWIFNRMRKLRMEVYYIPNMVVYHFISSRRLNQAWIKERYYYQGVSHTYANHSGLGKIKLIMITLMKQAFVTVKSLYVRGEGKKLLNHCRQESIKGTWGSIRIKGEGS